MADTVTNRVGQSWLVWDPINGGSTRTLRFDAILSESHQFSADVTEYAVEKGSNISDNARATLDRVRLDVFVSNSPTHGLDLVQSSDLGSGSVTRGKENGVSLDVPEYEAPLAPTPGAVFGAIGGLINSLLGGKKEYRASVLTFDTAFSAVSRTYYELDQLRKNGQLVKIITPMWDHSDMVLVNVEMNRDPGTGDSGQFSLEFKQMRVVETKQVAKPLAAQPRGAKAELKGVKEPVIPVVSAPKKSAAAGLLDGIL